MPGWRLHLLQGRPRRWALAMNGPAANSPWRITFTWDGEHASGVNLEQYH
ncbi:MAG: hypothetical protein ACREFJ_20265 [Acetobacteraceae bacterium]